MADSSSTKENGREILGIIWTIKSRRSLTNLYFGPAFAAEIFCTSCTLGATPAFGFRRFPQVLELVLSYRKTFADYNFLLIYALLQIYHVLFAYTTRRLIYFCLNANIYISCFRNRLDFADIVSFIEILRVCLPF